LPPPSPPPMPPPPQRLKFTSTNRPPFPRPIIRMYRPPSSPPYGGGTP
jgi:hypothetical protein